MNFDDIKRVFPKCPVKSIYQYRSDVMPVWFHLNGYGANGHGKEMNGFWDCIFTFAEIDPVEIKDNVKPKGLIVYRGVDLVDRNFVCIYDREFKVYKRV